MPPLSNTHGALYIVLTREKIVKYSLLDKFLQIIDKVQKETSVSEATLSANPIRYHLLLMMVSLST